MTGLTGTLRYMAPEVLRPEMHMPASPPYFSLTLSLLFLFSLAPFFLSFPLTLFPPFSRPKALFRPVAAYSAPLFDQYQSRLIVAEQVMESERYNEKVDIYSLALVRPPTPIPRSLTRLLPCLSLSRRRHRPVHVSTAPRLRNRQRAQCLTRRPPISPPPPSPLRRCSGSPAPASGPYPTCSPQHHRTRSPPPTPSPPRLPSPPPSAPVSSAPRYPVPACPSRRRRRLK